MNYLEYYSVPHLIMQLTVAVTYVLTKPKSHADVFMERDEVEVLRELQRRGAIK